MRFPRRLVACLAGACALGALNGPAPGRAQPAASPPLEVTLYGGTLRWQAAPGTRVTAELADASGVRATSQSTAGDDGSVWLPLFTAGGGFSRDASVEPGQTVRLARYGAPIVSVRVPELSADVDAAADRVSGTAPPGASLDLTLEHGATPGDVITRTVGVDVAGVWMLDLAGAVDIAPGDHGHLRYVDSAGHRFTLPFAPLSIDITVGAGDVRGRAPAGGVVDVAVIGPGGALKGEAQARVAGDTAWRVPGRWEGWVVDRIEAGDSLRVGFTPPGGTPTEVDVTVPDMSIVLDRARGAVAGRAPAGVAVTAEAWPATPGAAAIRQVVTSGPTGTYAADWNGAAAFEPGWRAVASIDIAPGVRARAITAVRRSDIQVHGNRVGGMLDPGAPITVTLTGADGAPKAASFGVQGDGLGTFEAWLWGGSGAAILPGDTVAIETSSGDPLELEVPELTARTDHATDVVSGEAPPGTEVTVGVAGAGAAGPSSVAVRADDQGAYRAALAGTLDLAPPMWGPVVATVHPAARFLTHWAAVRMTFSTWPGLTGIGPFELTGNGPPDRDVAATLRAPDGTAVASGRAEVLSTLGNVVFVGPTGAAGETPDWWLVFEDETGQVVGGESGDGVEAVVGDETHRFTLPPLDGVVFVADDRVTGRTEPGARLTLGVQRSHGGAYAVAAATAGPDGVFDHTFAPAFDIQHNDTVVAAIESGGHVVRLPLVVPGLRLDLDAGVLTGSWTPDTPIEVEARGPQGVRAAAQVVTNGDATFSVALTEPDGRPLELSAGDALTVRNVADPARPPLELPVPELTLSPDPATDVVRGKATPGGNLAVAAGQALGFDAVGGFDDAVGTAAIGADGTFTTDLVPGYDIRAATRVTAEYRLPSGHLVTRRVTVPALSVQDRGAVVCGFAPARAGVEVRSVDSSGAPAARGFGQADDLGWFTAAMNDAAGRPVAAGEGHTFTGTSAATPFAAVTVPPIHLELDWENRSGDGEGPPDTAYTAGFPASGCSRPVAWRAAFSSFTDADGLFSLWLDPVAPGGGFDLAFDLASGNQVFRSVFRPFAEVHVRTPIVSGRADALADVVLTLRNASGTVRGTAAATTRPDSRFSARLRDAAGEPAAIRPGDVVELAVGGSVEAIPVEALDFDFDAGREIVVDGPPDRAVTLRLTVATGAVHVFERRLDGSGRLRLTASEVPPRANWGLGDVETVRVELPTEGGHLIVAETRPVDDAAATVYLPALVKSDGLSRANPSAADGLARSARPARYVTPVDDGFRATIRSLHPR